MRHFNGSNDGFGPGPFNSIYGPMDMLLIPKVIAFANPAEYRKAISAWRFKLSHELVELWVLRARAQTRTQMQVLLGMSGSMLDTRLALLYQRLGVEKGEEASALAGLYGLGLDEIGG
jgi:hypothetical protein